MPHPISQRCCPSAAVSPGRAWTNSWQTSQSNSWIQTQRLVRVRQLFVTHMTFHSQMVHSISLSRKQCLSMWLTLIGGWRRSTAFSRITGSLTLKLHIRNRFTPAGMTFPGLRTSDIDACSERLQKSGVEASPVPEQFWHGRASTSFSAAFNTLMRERWPRDSPALHCSGSSTLILSSSTGPGPLMRRRRTTLSEERVIRS